MEPSCSMKYYGNMGVFDQQALIQYINHVVENDEKEPVKTSWKMS